MLRTALGAMAAALLLALSALAQEPENVEIKLKLDRPGRNAKPLPPRDLTQLQTSLTKRLPILGVEKGTVDAKSADEILVRFSGTKPTEAQLNYFTRAARFEVRRLNQVWSPQNTRGRYSLEVVTISGGKSDNPYLFRFVDRQSGLPVPAARRAEVLQEATLVGNSADLEPNAAVRESGALLFVEATFAKRAAARLKDATKRYRGQFLALTLDDEILNALVIADPIENGQVPIGGGFRNADEAKHLVTLLNAGALPARLTVVHNRLIEPAK